ncbi:MAG: TonB-dependent receptor [Prevotella sp.]|jgi:outer membrane receptor for ferrienterochelin and colicins|nr:TonB-dependent receptor [Prevotella sp.]
MKLFGSAILLFMPAMGLSAQGIRDSVELEPVVVTASHTPKTLKDAPVVTRLITLHDIKIVDATNIQDMLTQEIPGLEFGFAMTQETSLNMSGFGGNAVLFLLDGERLSGETMDNTDYSRLNLDNVGRIEIVKGASSALYGSNAVGGVVNIISRENLEPWTANANTRYNTFGNEWRNGASFSFNTEKWNSQTSFQHTKIDPVDLPKAHTSEEIAIELMKKAQGLPYDESVLSDDSNISRLFGQKTYNIKERLTFRATDRLTLIGRGGYFFRTSERDTYDYHFHAYSGGLKSRYAWDAGRHLELSYAYDQYDKANFLPDGTRTHDHDYSNQQHVAHALYSHSFGKNNLILGADYMHDYLTTYQFLDNASHAQDNIDGYAQFDWNITDRLNVVGSIRYDYFSASARKAFTERLAVVYKIPWMTLRVNYASGFRAPTLKEMYMHFDMGNMGYMIIGNPDLEPEKSHNFNLAVERTNRIRNSGFLDGRYNFTLMGYCNIFDKRITTIEGPEYNGMESALYWNEEGITVWGIDASLGHIWDCGASFKLNYSWMKETGNVYYSDFYQPRSHSLTWRIGYEHRFSRLYALDAALSGRCQGKPQSGRTDVDQGYTIWKLMLQHHLWRGIRLNTAIDNLFNYKPKSYYYSSPLTTGTSFNIGLSVDLDQLL